MAPTDKPSSAGTVVTRFTKPGESRFFFQNHLAFSCQRLVVYTYPVC